ncbi:MAG: hypothetical protein ABEN55_03345 [Bradymonadaceae bacterium]
MSTPDKPIDDSPVPASGLLVEWRDDSPPERTVHNVACAAVEHVDLVRSREELRKTEADQYDFVLINYDSVTHEECLEIFDLLAIREQGHRVLLHSEEIEGAEFAALFEGLGVSKFVARNHGSRSNELYTTIRKLLDQNIFGIEKYFAWGAKRSKRVLESSEQILDVVDEAGEFVDEIGLSRRLVRNFELVTGELVSNAIYDAPVDEQGNPRFRDTSRTESVQLDEDESVEVSFCRDGERVGVSVVDPFGSLSRERITEYLARCHRSDADQLDWSSGGAGLGLYQAFNSLTHFVANVDPGHRTEVIGLLNMTTNYRRFVEQGKSLNLFVTDTTGRSVAIDESDSSEVG